jgi:hypothetical protein
MHLENSQPSDSCEVSWQLQAGDHVVLQQRCKHSNGRRTISLLSASPVGEARLPMPKGMAYKD